MLERSVLIILHEQSLLSLDKTLESCFCSNKVALDRFKHTLMCLKSFIVAVRVVMVFGFVALAGATQGPW